MSYTKKTIVHYSAEELVELLWEIAPEIKSLLECSVDLLTARETFFAHLNDLERSYYNIYSDLSYKDQHIVERNNAKECIRVLKNVIRTENEKLTGFSALQVLRDLAINPGVVKENISPGFLAEFVFLFLGIYSKFSMDEATEILPATAEDAAGKRSERLDKYSFVLLDHFRRFRKGTDSDMTALQKEMKQRILAHFHGKENDWKDYRWHLRHIIKDFKTLSSLVNLDDDEREGIQSAEHYGNPFQITPHYLTLFNPEGKTEHDTVVRTMVIPTRRYTENLTYNRQTGTDMDFMGERSTSPVESVTRRYPQIVILKPFDSCPQICVYCQRNWEIKDIDAAVITDSVINKAIRWVSEHPSVSEVLVTGGDPLTLSDNKLDHILSGLAAIPHIERIRIGTRMLVTLPQRFTDNLLNIIAKYHIPGLRQVDIMTHFESPVEIVPATLEAITSIRMRGLSIYNQQVFTYYTSKRFETCYLRRTLKLSGIDPYYTFNTKGKEETLDFRVPISRLEQERKEEARLMPGIIRTDEPVFNVPKLGKSHLRAWQDHEIIMVLESGERVYRFYPWESKIAIVDDYLYTDVSIYDYLKRLASDGEDISMYKTIWYYF